MLTTIFQFTPEDKQFIENTCGKSVKEVNNDVEELKEWIKTQPHIPQEQDEKLLYTVLRLNKYKMEKAKRKMDMFYSIRNIVPDYYKDRDMFSEQMQNFKKQLRMTPLPKLLDQQYRIYLIRFLKPTPDSGPLDMLAFARLVFSIYDLRIHYDIATHDIFLIDTENLTFSYALRISPAICAKMYSVLERGYSDRIKGVHFINMPAVANILVAITKYILSFKLANRVYTYKKLESLHENIPKEYLPSNYGGQLKQITEIEVDWYEQMENNNDWLKEQGNIKTNESLRPKKAKSSGLFSYLPKIF